MSLVEALVAFTLSLLIVVGLWSAAAAARDQVAWIDGASTRADATRVVGLLMDLDAEGIVGSGRSGEVLVRAYRWWGVPCAAGRRGGASVSWRGSRRPDPSKDSVWILSATGVPSVRRVSRVTRARDCAEGSALHIEWQSDVVQPAVLLRGFERGGYTLDDAFRYRRGRGGAQPLTAAVFPPDSVGIVVETGRVLVEASRGARRMWVWP